jgi:hypothetical protein
MVITCALRMWISLTLVSEGDDRCVDPLLMILAARKTSGGELELELLKAT